MEIASNASGPLSEKLDIAMPTRIRLAMLTGGAQVIDTNQFDVSEDRISVPGMNSPRIAATIEARKNITLQLFGI